MRKERWVVAIAVLLGTLGLLPGAVALGSTITVQPGESIQAAIDEAPEGGEVWLAVGEWEEDIVIRKNLTLRGEGPDNSVIRVTEAGAGATVIIAPTGADPVWVVMTDLAVHGKANAAGIAAMRTAQLAISDCTISGSEFGLMLIDSAQLTMSGCTLRDNLLAGIALWDQAQGTITDCTISGSPSGIALGDAARATVEDNRVIDNEVGVLLIDDTAEVSGSGNLIPGPGEADGNTLAAFDPADLGFLVEPRVDPAPPTAQPGWRGVRAGDLCLTVPEDWSDFTEEFRRDVGELDSDEGEILAAWEGDAIESRVAIMRVSSEGREELKSLPEEDGGKLIVEGPYDLAGRPGGQLLFSFPDVNGEGRGWLVWQEAPGPGGFYLMVMAYYWAKDEPVLQETLASIGVCDDVATAPDVPTPPEAPTDDALPTVGTIRFTLDDETYSFPAVGHWDQETGGTAIAGGSEQAVVSLSFAGVDSPGSYSAETAGTTFLFQWLDGDPPFSPNVPGTPTYMATTGLFPLQLTIAEYGPVGGTIRGEFHGPTLHGEFEVERTQ